MAGKPQIEPTDEEKELQRQIEAFDRYPKLKKWTELFTDKNNKATYGNRTESAMQAYGCKNRMIAGSIGSQNFKKLQGLTSIFAENEGVTFDKLLNTLNARALSSDKPEWWKLAAEILGYYDPKAQFVVNNNTQNNVQVNIDGEAAEDFNKQFTEWVESQ